MISLAVLTVTAALTSPFGQICQPLLDGGQFCFRNEFLNQDAPDEAERAIIITCAPRAAAGSIMVRMGDVLKVRPCRQGGKP